jgi:uncharacterized repeat protein (TIGR01451 family)
MKHVKRSVLLLATLLFYTVSVTFAFQYFFRTDPKLVNSGLTITPTPEYYYQTRFSLSQETSMNLTELQTVQASQGEIENVTITGDLDCILDFTGYESVTIQTGAFSGQGFAEGNWTAVIGNLSAQGSWVALVSVDPVEGRINHKGAVTGDMTGISDGYVCESINGSGTYDLFHSVWTISRVGTDFISTEIELNGTVVYENLTISPSTRLFVKQATMEGNAWGYYTGPLSSVFTSVTIQDENSTYYGEGFSRSSLVSRMGIAEACTYEKTDHLNNVESKGMISGPLSGTLLSFLNITASPETSTGTIWRLDSGRAPQASLVVNAWGPQRVSPGQKMNYIIELRNNGLKPAYDVLVFSSLDPQVEYLGASEGAFYDEFTHTVSWDLSTVESKGGICLNVQTYVPWGLPSGTVLSCSVSTAYLGSLFALGCSVTGVGTETDIENRRGIYGNGVGAYGPWPFRNRHEQEISEDYSNKLDLEWIEVFQDGLLQDREDVVAAYDGIETETNHLGLFIGEVDEAHGFSGSTTMIIRQILDGNLKVKDRVRLISAFWFDPEGWRVVDALHDKCPTAEIEIWQSPNDRLPWGWWRQRQIKIPDNEENGRPWLHVVRRKEGHLGLLVAAYNDDVPHVYWKPVLCDTPVAQAHDPNWKYGLEGYVSAGQKLEYRVECENEGEGTAFGVYFTDTLDEDLNASTLEMGPVTSMNGSIIAGSGTYDQWTRTATWLVGEVGPGEGGYADFSVKVRDDASECAEVINYATVYFPSVPETTRTNAIVSVVGQPDIAVSNIAASKSVVAEGSTLNIDVVVANKGYYPEAFNVTLYVDTTAIQTENVTLLGRNNATIVFLWNTTGFAKGNYTLNAYVWPVIGETNTADNNFTDGWTIVAMVGDITGPDGWPDGKVDMRDIGHVARRFMCLPSDELWDPNADINNDLKIDMKDIGTVARHFMEHYP